MCALNDTIYTTVALNDVYRDKIRTSNYFTHMCQRYTCFSMGRIPYQGQQENCIRDCGSLSCWIQDCRSKHQAMHQWPMLDLVVNRFSSSLGPLVFRKIAHYDYNWKKVCSIIRRHSKPKDTEYIIAPHLGEDIADYGTCCQDATSEECLQGDQGLTMCFLTSLLDHIQEHVCGVWHLHSRRHKPKEPWRDLRVAGMVSVKKRSHSQDNKDNNDEHSSCCWKHSRTIYWCHTGSS